MKKKAVFCWSGGKDSSYCLHKVLEEGEYEVCYLLTTISGQFNRISMHGVREELLQKQVAEIGIPLLKVTVSQGTNDDYEKQMEAVLLQAKSEGIEHVIFGDIFLEDLRVYREDNLAKVGMTGVFPLWKMDTKKLVDDFINKGFKTITCCINDEHLDETWVGKNIDAAFVRDLPAAVDACGENGEFHTFCYAGPIFKNDISFEIGEKVYRPLVITTDDVCAVPASKTKGFWFCDLLLKGN
ncbi:MAG: diphthine--ammonia ligase [Bacteroidetes bacterium]|nr:diphthine--ammonia ligase [Bacteroidota bacterium]